MIAGGLQWLKTNASHTLFEVSGRKYANFKPVPVENPVPAPLAFFSLNGLSDYMEKNPDEQDKFIIHVESPTAVSIRSTLCEPFCQRWEYAVAEIPFVPFTFGRFLDLEAFLIGVRSMFVLDTSAPTLLKYAGNITDEDVRTWEDDGITQRANARTGVARVSEIALPSIVTLRPFRTFSEVEQPASEFLFRIQSKGGKIEAALFEADGGRWKIEAMRNIAKFFSGKNIENAIVLA